MASSLGMSARATSSDQRLPRDKLAASSILSGGTRRGSSFLKPPRNLGVGTKTVMPRRSASARSARCGESGLTLMAVALFHGSMLRSRAAAWMSHKEPQPNKVGFMYMLRGDGGASNTDPYATNEEPGNDWIKTGAHVMIVGSGAKMLDGYPRDPKADPTKPY